MKKALLLSGLVLACGLLPGALYAAGGADEVTKLRETLRNTMLQTRDLQNQIATLQAQDADKALTIEDLTKKLEMTQKRMADDKAMADRAIALLQEQNESFQAEIGRLQVSIEKWKASHKEASALAAKTEMLRSKLAREKVVLERIVADQRVKNHEMYKVGIEVLDRYKKHSLGDSILAREPFAGNMRARLQTLSQEYGDKLADQRIKPSDAAVSAAAATANATATN
jgi:SMC interacting uncharacterized protein involved in chromosome segregation